MRLETYAALLGAPVTGRYLQTDDAWTPDHPHLGVDFGCPKGTDVPAIAAGMVYEIRTWTSGPGNGTFGLHLIVKRDNGTYDLYAHLSTVLVNVGERVSAGETIVLSGDTGKNGPGTYAPHLHVQNASHSYFPRDLTVTNDPFTKEDEVTKEQYEALVAKQVEQDKRLAVLTEAVSTLNAGLVQYDANGPYDTIKSVRDLNEKVKEVQAELAAHTKNTTTGG